MMQSALNIFRDYQAWSAPDVWLAGVVAATLAGDPSERVLKRTKEEYRERNATTRAKVAARAIAEGREPGKVGRPRKPATTEQQMRWRAAADKYRLAHPERVIATRKATRLRHIEKRRLEDAEVHRAKRRQIAAETGVPLRSHTKRHLLSPDALAIHDAAIAAAAAINRRALERNAPGKRSPADIKVLRDRQAGKCAFCLKALPVRGVNVDHYIPLAKGGTNELSNLRLLHERCNKRKSAKHPLDFAVQNGLLCW